MPDSPLHAPFAAVFHPLSGPLPHKSRNGKRNPSRIHAHYNPKNGSRQSLIENFVIFIFGFVTRQCNTTFAIPSAREIVFTFPSTLYNPRKTLFPHPFSGRLSAKGAQRFFELLHISLQTKVGFFCSVGVTARRNPFFPPRAVLYHILFIFPSFIHKYTISRCSLLEHSHRKRYTFLANHRTFLLP